MNIILAENSGFCYGVKKAISTTLDLIENSDTKLFSLGPLIHNKYVISKLEDMGLVTIDDIKEIDSGRLIIRSHGVGMEIYNQAEDKSVELIDCTCPFVRKIQLKVKQYYDDNYKIVIIGDANHPEVIGINGWCNNEAYVVNSEQDVDDIPKCDKICIVAQTTITTDKFEKLSQEVSKKGEKVEIFNTICNTTYLRQQACEEIAKKVKAMIVIGGHHSSNTQKLAEISRKYCPNTYHVENVDELPLGELKKFETVGITAGASTPESIIKEVINKMSNSENQMNDMMEAIENSMIRLHRGSVVKGKVISVNDDEVMVNIGYKADGIIKREELSNDPHVNPYDLFKMGDEIEVFILSLDDGDGNVVLSKKRVDNIKGFEELEDVFKNDKRIDAKVIEVVNGGLIAVVNGIRAFIPASHASTRYVNDLKAFIGKLLSVKIIDLNIDKKKVVLSRKIAEKEEKEKEKEKLWNKIDKGQKIEGEVKRLTDFGAFVDIGGVDGLIHVSDLSWQRIKHPSEVVKEGDRVEVIVLDFDKDKEKVSLGLKQTIPHPWENISTKYNIGDIVEGTVNKLVDFGAFVRLETGVDGLVHISQIANEHILKPGDKLKVGQKIYVKILDINNEGKKISLSIKEAEAKKEDEIVSYTEDPGITIGDIIKDKE